MDLVVFLAILGISRFSADILGRNLTPPSPGPRVPWGGGGDLSGGLFISTAAFWTLSFSDFFSGLSHSSTYFGT